MNDKVAVYLDPEEHQLLKDIAAAENRSTTEIMHEAIADYLARHPVAELPEDEVATDENEIETAEELLKGSGPG